MVPVKTKAAGDTGTGRIADHPAGDETGRAEQKGARSGAERAVEQPLASARRCRCQCQKSRSHECHRNHSSHEFPPVMRIDALRPQPGPHIECFRLVSGLWLLIHIIVIVGEAGLDQHYPATSSRSDGSSSPPPVLLTR